MTTALIRFFSQLLLREGKKNISINCRNIDCSIDRCAHEIPKLEIVTWIDMFLFVVWETDKDRREREKKSCAFAPSIYTQHRSHRPTHQMKQSLSDSTIDFKAAEWSIVCVMCIQTLAYYNVKWNYAEKYRYSLIYIGRGTWNYYLL